MARAAARLGDGWCDAAEFGARRGPGRPCGGEAVQWPARSRRLHQCPFVFFFFAGGGEKVLMWHPDTWVPR
uniref:Uncharacterized protein n=1 Tax=Oryza nivara TaxID=4536 RepID=A0A0E0H3K9_ORYNI